MPTIKTTSSGLIVTIDGLPSCVCCGPCSPDVVTLYVEYQNDDASFSYYELSGSLNAGFFTGVGTYGALNMTWDEINELWVFDDDGHHATIIPNAVYDQRCDAEQICFFPATGTSVMISFTPLP